MKYTKAQKYTKYMNLIMGPNPIKLEEELLLDNKIPQKGTVMDLGSGQGLTSIFLCNEYGFKVYAADLWSNPEDIQKFFDKEGMDRERITPVHADANNVPFEKEFFDAVVSTDSYNYFGRDEKYLDEKLLPFVKHGGYVYAVVPGMKKDLHDNLPPELLLSWTPEQLDYLHDAEYWRNILSHSKDGELVWIKETEGNEELWNDWVTLDNEYAVGDRKSIEAGACKYLNFVAFAVRKK